MHVQFNGISAKSLRQWAKGAAFIGGIGYLYWSYSDRQQLMEANRSLQVERNLAVTETHDIQSQMEEIAIRLLRMEFTVTSLKERGQRIDRTTVSKVGALIKNASMELSSDEALLRLVTSHQLFSGPKTTKGVLAAYTRMLDATNVIETEIKGFNERMATLETSVGKRIKFLDMMPTSAPVEGKITSQFGVRFSPTEAAHRKKHIGIDIGGKVGTPIRAPADGIVRSAHKYGSYGNYISVIHGDTMTTRFAHLDDIRVKRGDKVVRGQIIGTLGNTGKSTGPHLHYEVLYNQRNIDPLLITEFSDSTKKELASH